MDRPDHNMTAARILELNGLLTPDAPLMQIVRRIHAVCGAAGLTYCVIGGAAVIRNGYRRTTTDVDILVHKADWQKILPLQGEISSDGIDSCTDAETGVSIDVLFAGEDWGMPIPMPDPATVRELDERYGGYFISLHELVQLKTAVYLSKLAEDGENVASKDRSDVFELISRNLGEFTSEKIGAYHPALRKHCLRAFKDAVRAERRRRSK